MATAEPGRTRRRFEPWPWVLALLLAAMISVSLSLWAIASANRDGVVGDAWEAGLRFNDELAARSAAEALGLALEVDLSQTSSGVRVHASLGGAEPESVSVERIRPAESGYDRSWALERSGAGWEREIPLPRAGRWRLRVHAEVEGARVERIIDYRQAGTREPPK